MMALGALQILRPKLFRVPAAVFGAGVSQLVCFDWGLIVLRIQTSPVDRDPQVTVSYTRDVTIETTFFEEVHT